MLHLVNSMSRLQKQAFLLVVDLFLVPIALFSTIAIQERLQLVGDQLELWLVAGLTMVMASALSIILRIPYIRLNAFDLSGIGKIAIFAAVLAVVTSALGGLAKLELGAGFYVVFGIIFFLLSGGSRVAMLQILLALFRRMQPRRRVLIYGAGTTGMQLASALKTHEMIEPMVFIDDNVALQGLTIAGLPVMKPARIRSIIKSYQINRVLLAMPSLSGPKLARIARNLEKMGIEVQALPSFAKLIGEEELIDKLAPVFPDQMLGRSRLDSGIFMEEERYAGCTVLVSGAGGSIGSELCRQALAYKPEKLVLFELSEIALYNIDMELKSMVEGTSTEVIPILGSVTDARLVKKVLGTHKVKIVLHAAAYKHVPLVEANPLAGLANNVLGTATLARASCEAGVERFILVSSDKAVRPTNVMGASKRLAELVVQDLANRSMGTVFAMVRFGNVLNSSGSVIPLFQEQIARGGPVTLTHNEVTRYFMTIQEASRLVLRAGSYAEGGEVFVLDMGKPISIRTLARNVIEASGCSVRDEANPDGDIEIVVIGLRPGEKLQEELLISEGQMTTRHEKIFIAREASLSEIEVASAVRALRSAAASADDDSARRVMAQWVEGYSGELDNDSAKIRS